MTYDKALSFRQVPTRARATCSRSHVRTLCYLDRLLSTCYRGVEQIVVRTYIQRKRSRCERVQITLAGLPTVGGQIAVSEPFVISKFAPRVFLWFRNGFAWSFVVSRWVRGFGGPYRIFVIHQCFQPAIGRHVDTDAANGSRRVSETKTTPCSPDESKDPLQLENRKQLPTLNAIIEIDS